MLGLSASFYLYCSPLFPILFCYFHFLADREFDAGLFFSSFHHAWCENE